MRFELTTPTLASVKGAVSGGITAYHFMTITFCYFETNSLSASHPVALEFSIRCYPRLPRV